MLSYCIVINLQQSLLCLSHFYFCKKYKILLGFEAESLRRPFWLFLLFWVNMWRTDSTFVHFSTLGLRLPLQRLQDRRRRRRHLGRRLLVEKLRMSENIWFQALGMFQKIKVSVIYLGHTHLQMSIAEIVISFLTKNIYTTNSENNYCWLRILVAFKKFQIQSLSVCFHDLYKSCDTFSRSFVLKLKRSLICEL
jgi:hypothetical protein